MPDTLYQVLFLCTGNSARSILAEAILNRRGAGRFRAQSAGSDPAGIVDPHALALLEERGYDVRHLHSKSVNEFVNGQAPDLVVTVCDAAAERCPVIPGAPLTIHWGLPDPAAVTGDERTKRAAFANTFERLSTRLEKLVSLPIDGMDRDTLERKLKEIANE